jgi:hypothetical protein
MADEAKLETPGARLKWARERHGKFEKPTDAARAHGWTVSTYLGHENGDRPLTAKAARRYAQVYKVPWPWLLDGGPLPEKTAPDRPGWLGDLLISYARNDDGMSAVLKNLDPTLQARFLMDQVYDPTSMPKGSEEEQAVFTLVRHLMMKKSAQKG